MEWSGAVSLGAMTQRITRDEVVHVARLARLSLSDAEIDEFTGQLGDILEHAADIEALDVGDADEQSFSETRKLIHPSAPSENGASGDDEVAHE